MNRLSLRLFWICGAFYKITLSDVVWIKFSSERDTKDCSSTIMRTRADATIGSERVFSNFLSVATPVSDLRQLDL